MTAACFFCNCFVSRISVEPMEWLTFRGILHTSSLAGASTSHCKTWSRQLCHSSLCSAKNIGAERFEGPFLFPGNQATSVSLQDCPPILMQLLLCQTTACQCLARCLLGISTLELMQAWRGFQGAPYEANQCTVIRQSGSWYDTRKRAIR